MTQPQSDVLRHIRRKEPSDGPSRKLAAGVGPQERGSER